jgi:hypothetical protein
MCKIHFPFTTTLKEATTTDIWPGLYPASDQTKPSIQRDNYELTTTANGFLSYVDRLDWTVSVGVLNGIQEFECSLCVMQCLSVVFHF